MAVKIVFAVLAHQNLPAVEDLAANIARTCPHSEIIIFNGGSDRDWLDGTDLRVSARSRPLRWGYLADFHAAVMADVADSSYDCLVTLDADMLIIKDGFEDQTEELLANFAYIGAEFAPFGRFEETHPIRLVRYHWDRHWQPLFETPVPYAVVNPGQVFRRDLVDGLLADARLPALLAAAAAARTTCMEEVIYPTLAVANAFPATCNPGTHGIAQRRFDPAELELLAADPNVFLVHKVGFELDSVDRQTVHRLVKDPTTISIQDAARRLTVRALPPQTPTRHRLKGALENYAWADLKSILRGP